MKTICGASSSDVLLLRLCSRQRYRCRRAFPAHHQSMQVGRADWRRQGEELAIREAAAAAGRDVLAGHEMAHALDTAFVELRMIALNGRDLLLHCVADVHNEGAVPVALLGVERKWGVHQMRHAIRMRAAETVVPFGQLRVEARRLD